MQPPPHHYAFTKPSLIVTNWNDQAIWFTYHIIFLNIILVITLDFIYVIFTDSILGIYFFFITNSIYIIIFIIQILVNQYFKLLVTLLWYFYFIYSLLKTLLWYTVIFIVIQMQCSILWFLLFQNVGLDKIRRFLLKVL